MSDPIGYTVEVEEDDPEQVGVALILAAYDVMGLAPEDFGRLIQSIGQDFLIGDAFRPERDN